MYMLAIKITNLRYFNSRCLLFASTILLQYDIIQKMLSLTIDI